MPPTVDRLLAKVVVLMADVVVASVVVVVVLVLLGLFLHAYVRVPPVSARRVRRPRGRNGAVVAALIGVLLVAVWYALEVIPAWQYRSRPPDAPFEWSEFREGNVAEVLFQVLVLLCLFGCGVVTAVVTLVLAIIAYVRKEWKPATLALAILAAAVAACLIGLQIIG